MRLKRLLCILGIPPSTVGGAPIIARQHLRRYDQDALHILCDARGYRAARRLPGTELLPCPHTTVPNLEFVALRPRRIFAPLFNGLNLARIPLIKRKARRIIACEGIEAIFTIPAGADFALAAYELSRETDLPLYVFENDDWHAMNRGPIVAAITRRAHRALLSHAEHLWVISPEMARRYRERFGVEGEFLFHFVDPEVYQRATPREVGDPSVLRLVYTGAINNMFLGSLQGIAEWINAGMRVNGRRVILDVWSTWCPERLRGPAVRWRGFVPSTEVPGILAGADALLIAITFARARSGGWRYRAGRFLERDPLARADTPGLQDFIRSSLYTKTVDYLASGKPLVVVSPRDTAELAYVGPFVWAVDRLEPEAFQIALMEATGSAEARRRADAGVELIRADHTPETMGERFLSRFRAPE